MTIESFLTTLIDFINYLLSQEQPVHLQFKLRSWRAKFSFHLKFYSQQKKETYIECFACGLPDTGNGKDYFPAEKHSAYLTEFIRNLGHQTIQDYQTKYFDVAKPNTNRDLFQYPPECPQGSSGVVSTFMIPSDEDCATTTGKNNIFLSYENNCDFGFGMFFDMTN